MNSVERVLAALRGEQPDRVPVVEFLVDERVACAACRRMAQRALRNVLLGERGEYAKMDLLNPEVLNLYVVSEFGGLGRPD